MAVTTTTVTFEEELNVTPSRLWTAFKDSRNLFPKIVPDIVSSIELIEGDGGVGSLRVLTFGAVAAAMAGGLTVKEKIEVVDNESKTMTLTAIEGVNIGKDFVSYKRTSIFKPGKDESSTIAVLILEYEPIGEASIDGVKKCLSAILKAGEAYLQAHPDEYTS